MFVFFKRIFRRLGVFWYSLRKKSVVISNNTNKKIFLERKPGDFERKRAIKIYPGTTVSFVVSFCRGNLPTIRDTREEIFEISSPVLQVCVNLGKKPGTYDCMFFD